MDTQRPAPNQKNSLHPGDKIGQFVVVKFAGWRNNYSFYVFRCECGETFTAWGAQVKSDWQTRALCKCRRKLDGHSRHPAYTLWVRRNYELAPAWAKDFWRFANECWPHRTEDKDRLWPIAKGKLIGPRNFHWTRGVVFRRDELKQAVIDDLVRRGETKAVAAERVESVSRQRLFQLFYRANGKCMRCQEPTGGKECQRCRKLQRDSRRRTYHKNKALA